MAKQAAAVALSWHSAVEARKLLGLFLSLSLGLVSLYRVLRKLFVAIGLTGLWLIGINFGVHGAIVVESSSAGYQSELSL